MKYLLTTLSDIQCTYTYIVFKFLMHRRKCSNSTNWDWGWWIQYCPTSTIWYGAVICPFGDILVMLMWWFEWWSVALHLEPTQLSPIQKGLVCYNCLSEQNHRSHRTQSDAVTKFERISTIYYRQITSCETSIQVNCYIVLVCILIYSCVAITRLGF